MHTDCQTSDQRWHFLQACSGRPLQKVSFASLSSEPVKSDKEEILWSLSNHSSVGEILWLFKYKIHHPKLRKLRYPNGSNFNKQLKRCIIMLNP